MPVVYSSEPHLALDEFRDVLERSTLSRRRPMSDQRVMSGILENSDVLITARMDGKLVGISRAITDFSYCTYLADLAVDQAFHGQGIGRLLIEKTHEAAGRHTLLILLAAPEAESYYPHIGLEPHHSCWTSPRQLPAVTEDH